MKAFQYITILLFAAVSVFIGCRNNSQPREDYPAGGDTVYIGRGTGIPLNAKPIKIPKPDTIIIHDTIYRPKNVHIRKAENVYIGGKTINVNGDNNNVINQ